MINAHQSDVLIFLMVLSSIVPKPKDSSFTVTNNHRRKKKQEIPTFKMLEPATVIAQKNDWNSDKNLWQIPSFSNKVCHYCEHGVVISSTYKILCFILCVCMRVRE